MECYSAIKKEAFPDAKICLEVEKIVPSAGGRRKPVSEGSFYVTAVKMAQERLTTESRGVRGGRAFRRGEVESQRVGRTGRFREPLGELAIQGVRARDPISHEDTHVPTRTHKHTYTCTHTHTYKSLSKPEERTQCH